MSSVVVPDRYTARPLSFQTMFKWSSALGRRFAGDLSIEILDV